MKINTETSVGIFVLGALAIFFYMTFHIGVFRLNSSDFRKQVVYFKDVSGLSKKADVKIAGVKVGWIANITLAPKDADDQYSARADIMVLKKYKLHADACAFVRQDGLLGVKYLEILPGDSLSPALKAGETLGKPGKAPVSIDELLKQCSTIATHVEEITESLRKSFIDRDAGSRIESIMIDLQKTAHKVAHFSEIIDRLAECNEADIEGIIKDVRAFAFDLREAVPLIKEDFHEVASQLTAETLPQFSRNVELIARSFDRDFGTMAETLEKTADAIQEAAHATRDGFKSIGAVADKINEGKGLIGKLVNEDQTYHDLKIAVEGLKNYFAKVDSLEIIFDSHFETMYAPAENFELKDAKGYIDIRLQPTQDCFYVMQILGSTKGSIKRTVTDRVFYNTKNEAYNPDTIGYPAQEQFWRLAFAPRIEETVRVRDAVKYGLQFGKTFKDISLRFGIFENSFGIGIDFDIPFDTDKMRWITSFEAFDLRGRDRLHDQMPHLKWINRVFLLRSLYIDFGADDFISRNNANTFFGFGLRFSDDDIKYFISKFGFGGSGGGSLS